jgi:hypothetical protein
MKKIMLIIIVLAINSCHNSPSLNTLNEMEMGDYSAKMYSTQILIKEKFLEFYDLNLLLKNNLSFQNKIKERLKSFTLDSLPVLDLSKDSKIENIQQKGMIINLSDSIQKTKLIFNVLSKKNLRKDSISVFIFKKKLRIHSDVVISTKVKFSRY